MELERLQVKEERNAETACLQWGLRIECAPASESAHTPCTASTTAPPSVAPHKFDRRTRHGPCSLCRPDLRVRSQKKNGVKRDASLSGQRRLSWRLPLCKGECYRRLFHFMDAANHSEPYSVRRSALSGPHTQVAQLRAVSCTFKPVFSAIHPFSQAAMATICSATCSIFATRYPRHTINIELLREGVKRSGATMEDEAAS